MENKRKIPYGVINWAELVRECFIVDNTRYIRELEAIKTPVFLRPKRFGKSVVCSMLAHYYDVNLKDRPCRSARSPRSSGTSGRT